MKLFHQLIFGIFLFASPTNGCLRGWWESQSRYGQRSENVTVFVSNDPKEVVVDRYDQFTMNYTISGDILSCVNLSLTSNPKTITTLPETQMICPETALAQNSLLYVFNTSHEGIVVIETTADPPDVVDVTDSFVSLSVRIDPAIDTVSDIFGWIYTVAWDISFLPQIVHNWRRQSVIGLSFDFLTYNFIGFSCYFIFNMGLYWIDGIQEAYYVRHPYSILHVRLNDVIFPLYAVACTAVQIIQCFIYEKGDQRVSLVCRILSGIMLASIVVFTILVGVLEDLWWLDLLYWLSYIKLAITCVKYTPQLLINYKNKSTEGWSIWQVILDFTGGSLSLLQMFLLAYNYDDFHSVLTDPTKLGLGLLSVFFNIFFFIQHFCLYRNNIIKEVPIDDKEKGFYEKDVEEYSNTAF